MAKNFGRIALRMAAVLLAAGIVVGATYAMTPPYHQGQAVAPRSPQEWIDRFAQLPLGEGATRMAIQVAVLLGAAVIGHRALRRRP